MYFDNANFYPPMVRIWQMGKLNIQAMIFKNLCKINNAQHPRGFRKLANGQCKHLRWFQKAGKMPMQTSAIALDSWQIFNANICDVYRKLAKEQCNHLQWLKKVGKWTMQTSEMAVESWQNQQCNHMRWFRKLANGQCKHLRKLQKAGK